MHERIKELTKESDLEECIDDAYLMRDDWHPFIEKFAELIVQECTNVLRKEWFDENNKVSEEGPREVAMQVGRKNALLAAINKVKNILE